MRCLRLKWVVVLLWAMKICFVVRSAAVAIRCGSRLRYTTKTVLYIQSLLYDRSYFCLSLLPFSFIVGSRLLGFSTLTSFSILFRFLKRFRVFRSRRESTFASLSRFLPSPLSSLTQIVNTLYDRNPASFMCYQGCFRLNIFQMAWKYVSAFSWLEFSKMKIKKNLSQDTRLPVLGVLEPAAKERCW